MDKVRELHNKTKKEFITSVVKQPNANVLDVGCGRGGDLAKWRGVKANVVMIDPDKDAVEEAKKRAYSVYPCAEIMLGDVRFAPDYQFDHLCYNFSLQYIFIDEMYMKQCIMAISQRLKPGGIFFGVVPDANKILKLPLEWKDSLGNEIKRGLSIGKEGPRFGEMILVRLADGPYYAAGAVPEPLAYKSKLVEICFEYKLAMVEWKPFINQPNGLISDIYSRFIFRKLR